LTYSNRKKTATKDAMTRKRKAIDDEIQELKRRKRELSTDTVCADQLADKAESCCDMSILVKSNVMHKASKEKVIEMTELDEKLADKLLEQKNCV